MVEATLRVIDPNFALLYGQGRVHRLGALQQLEDQMCGFLPAGHCDVDLRPDGISARLG
jgi:phage terminase large subunit-like protein